jgi:type II secretory pathway pseudopilin PulG
MINKQISKSANLQKGQSLFELVVAIGISALVIVVLVSLTSNALQNAAFAKNETLAGNYAQEATEWLRGQRDADINNFITNVESSGSGAKCFNTLNWSEIGPCGVGETITNTSFVRQITFTSKDVVIGGVTKIIIEAEVTVSWTDSKGLHEVTNATDFSDWRQR